MIEVKNIIKNYQAGDQEVKALKGVSMNFRDNEFVSILGPSGCGKTTLLNIIGGLDKYTDGDIVIDNVSTKDYEDRDWDTYRNHYIGFVFQSYNLIPHLSILENVELALSIAGTNNKQKREMALKALKKVGLSDQIKKKPNQLSGGQMQRVAIARAIVNNPKIILADEPTGALDSETSIQVMDILKEISKTCLVVMVTHNGQLADEYSDRIIKMLDGEITHDSKPYDVKEGKLRKKKAKKQSAMSFATAFSLSFKNLISKKWKTILESFAGSIGIVGIALVLAVQTGMTGYVNSIQSDALGNYPITVAAVSVDTQKFTSVNIERGDDENIDDDVMVPFSQVEQFVAYGHYNNLKKSFVDHVKAFEQEDKDNGSKNLNLIDYNYYIPVKTLTQTSTGDIKYVARVNSTSILTGSASSVLYPMIDNMDFVMGQYDLIYGEMPDESGEYSKDMLLVLGKGNKISVSILDAIGINYERDVDDPTKFKEIDFDDIIGKEYKLLFNDDYYTPDSTTFDEITSFSKLDITNQTDLAQAYNDASVTLKISGILRPKDDATAELLTSGLTYMRSLENYYANNCKNSLIATKQLTHRESFYDNYVLSVAEMADIIMPEGFSSVAEINAFLTAQYGYTLSEDDAFDLAMQQIGISETPITIKFYPKNFDAKDSIVKMIEEFNSMATTESEKIVYSDTTGFLTSTLGSIVNIISYVLIAFTGISLVVSSIMIGIITYTSVIERTKEIGVLRSIGARKKDISRVFNSETFIIGLTAGLLGVSVSFALTFPISALIKKLAGDSITTRLAILTLKDATILVAVSVVLTLIAGLIPARLAAKKDPVKALRTE